MNVKELINKEVQVTAIHAAPKDLCKTWIVLTMEQLPEFSDAHIYALSGYINIPFTKNGDIFSLTIVDAYLIEKTNGGRTNTKHYDSVDEYYSDPQVKETVLRVSYGGILARMLYQGDPDMLDLIVVFDNGESISEALWEVKPPVAWHSDALKNDDTFKFKNGFFDTQEEAIASVSGEAHDDLFGERYFPVLVFPDSVERSVVEEVAYGAKSWSDVLKINGNYIVGLRCKSFEYSDCIHACYEAGGKVSKGVEWDWD